MARSTPRLAHPLINLGLVELRRGAYERASARFRRAVAIYEREFGRDHAELAEPLKRLAETLVLQGRPESALPLLERALELGERHPGDPADLAAIRFALAPRPLVSSGPTRARALPRRVGAGQLPDRGRALDPGARRG